MKPLTKDELAEIRAFVTDMLEYALQRRASRTDHPATNTTIGEIAYEAYCQAIAGGFLAGWQSLTGFEALSDVSRNAWEAAAKAVVDSVKRAPRMD